MEEERSDRLPLHMDPAVLDEVYKQDDLFGARDIVYAYPVEDAVSIIDNLNQLATALVLGMIRHKARDSNKYAKAIVAKADEQRIRGTAGLIYARDKVFRETGFFAGL